MRDLVLPRVSLLRAGVLLEEGASMMSIEIGTDVLLTHDESLWCRELALAKVKASRQAGSRSEATRFTQQSAEQISEVSAVGEKGFSKMTGLQMDESAFHRSAAHGQNSLSDFRAPGIGKVELKSTPYADMEYLRVPKHSLDASGPPDAFALVWCHRCVIVSWQEWRASYERALGLSSIPGGGWPPCEENAKSDYAYLWREVTFWGIVLAQRFYAHAELRTEEVQSGQQRQRYWLERKYLSALQCDGEGRWRVEEEKLTVRKREQQLAGGGSS